MVLMSIRDVFRRREHELDAVLLVDLAGAGVVVDRHDVGLRIEFLDLAQHAAADDVVWQTAKRLGADDVFAAGFDELDHFCGEEPAFAHLGALVDDFFAEGLGVLERRLRLKLRIILVAVDDGVLQGNDVVDDEFRDDSLGVAGAVEVPVLDAGVGGVEHEIHQPRHDDLAVLLLEESFEVVVAQRRKFYVNLADNADLGLFLAADGFDLGKFPQNPWAVFAQLLAGAAMAGLKLALELAADAVDGGGDFVLVEGVRQNLVFQVHDHVAVDDGEHGVFEQDFRELEAWVVLEADDVEREHRDVFQPGTFEGLAQERNVVRRTATAAGLRQEQSNLVGVIAVVHGAVEELTDGQLCRIAHVVVDVFDTGGDDIVTHGVEDVNLVALHGQELLDQTKMDRQHQRNEDGVRFLHFFCKNRN